MQQANELIRELNTTLKDLTKEIGVLSSDMSAVKTQLGNITENLNTSIRRHENEIKSIHHKVDESFREIRDITNRIVSLETDTLEETIERITSELKEAQSKIGKVESQQSKWLGAISVLVILATFILSIVGKMIS